jgi:tryptophan 7-halogenase
VTESSPIRIAIAGGGTAGWMVAAAFSKFLETGFEITLVESDAIGTVGVGEATIPQMRLFNDALGLDEAAFMRATQGTFKLAIEFVDWLKPGHRYMHAFGDVGRDVGLMAFQHSWARARRAGLAKDLAHYSLNNMASLQNRMQRGPARTAKLLGEMPYAFHFDAGLYAAYLRRYAEARGVTRVEGRIVDVRRDGESGDIGSLALEGDREIAADLFIDCTGFIGLLIEKTLGAGYEDWTHWLPADRAVAVPCERTDAPILPYTRSTARPAGWQWRIPLQHRTGNGMVYSSTYMSEDEATAMLLANLDGAPTAEPRPIKFTTGKRKAFWKNNVIAVGLSSGFMEPLESTSIHLIQSAIQRIMKLMPGRQAAEADRREFNRQSDFEMDRIRDFIILHYKANAREGAFWQHCRDMPVPDFLAEKIALFRANGHIVREHEELFTEVGWLQVMAGQGIIPEGNHPIADTISKADLAEYMDTLEKIIAREAAQMPRHTDFVNGYCAAPTLPQRAAA